MIFFTNVTKFLESSSSAGFEHEQRICKSPYIYIQQHFLIAEAQKNAFYGTFASEYKNWEQPTFKSGPFPLNAFHFSPKSSEKHLKNSRPKFSCKNGARTGFNWFLGERFNLQRASSKVSWHLSNLWALWNTESPLDYTTRARNRSTINSSRWQFFEPILASENGSLESNVDIFGFLWWKWTEFCIQIRLFLKVNFKWFFRPFWRYLATFWTHFRHFFWLVLKFMRLGNHWMISWWKTVPRKTVMTLLWLIFFPFSMNE